MLGQLSVDLREVQEELERGKAPPVAVLLSSSSCVSLRQSQTSVTDKTHSIEAALKAIRSLCQDNERGLAAMFALEVNSF